MKIQILLYCIVTLIFFQLQSVAQWRTEEGFEDIFVEALLVCDNTIYAGADTMIFIKSSDEERWLHTTTLPVDPGAGVSTMIKTGNRLFAGTHRHGVFETIDEGNSWLDRSSGLSKDYSVTSFSVRDNFIYAGTSGNGIFKMDLNSSAPEWIPFRKGLPFNTGAWDVNTIFNNNGTLISGAGQSGYIYLNESGSDEWQYQQFGEMGGEGLGMWSFCNVNDILIGGASSGIFRSTDNGIKWDYFNPGAGYIVPVKFAEHGSKIFAALTKATFGTLIFSSVNEGEEWLPEEDLPGVLTFDLAVFGEKLYAAGLYGFYYLPLDPTGVVDDIVPGEFVLHQNFPNPFNPSTKIKFTIPDFGDSYIRSLPIKLSIYDILGNEIATLINKEKSQGSYEVEFSADKYGLSSGVYYYRIKAGNFVQTKKMLLMK